MSRGARSRRAGVAPVTGLWREVPPRRFVPVKVQRREDPCGHPRQACLREHRREALDEPADRLIVAAPACLVTHDRLPFPRDRCARKAGSASRQGR
jgi:hypothetical protein